MAIPLIPAAIAGVATVGGMVLTRLRPSRIVRGVEDGVVAASSKVASTTSSAVRAVRVEYSARKIDALRRDVEKAAKKMRALDAAERARLAAEQADILDRAEQLAAERGGGVEPGDGTL